MVVSRITDLPLDILVIIFPSLDVKSFLAFCSTCKAFQQESIRLDPLYWSRVTRSTFRVPNQPVVEHDGARWQKLFRRLLTQSRIFTWGNNAHSRLGHEVERPSFQGPRRIMRRGIPHLSFPTEVEKTNDLGIIADMQCGGWSTTILTSKGSLHVAGVLNGMTTYGAGPGFNALHFPVGFPYSTERSAYEEPSIAIRQFSSGRTHVLGLADSGRIWSWYDVDKPALQVKFFNADINEASSGESSPMNTPLYGRVKKVLAGWCCSSAYIYGYGIIVWETVERQANDNSTDPTDTVLMEHVEVPMTGYQRTKGASRETDQDKALGEEIGVVLNYILLEQYVVFVTDIGKVFCGKFGENLNVPEIFELQALRNEGKTPSEIDVQGTFKRFAIFKNGEVITTSQDYLDDCRNAQSTGSPHSSEGLQYIPALQHNNVISVAFGDYHFLALHSDGKITSYGTEMQGCGALGLGGDSQEQGSLRGIDYAGQLDGKLLPHAYSHGRQVWFEPEKKEWLSFLAAGGKDPEEAQERMQLFTAERNVQGEVSEWIEQEGRALWADTSEDGLGSYFALGVSAAGWHSGALVLVSDRAERDQSSWTDNAFPRLRLSDGREMPGTVDFDEWRNGRPEWQLNVEL